MNVLREFSLAEVIRANEKNIALHGEAVAASSMHLGDGVVGIYNVATLPEARGKGAGSAVTYAPLRAAQERGYEIGTLQASRLGYGVYCRLGFKDICRFHLYVGAVGG